VGWVSEHRCAACSFPAGCLQAEEVLGPAGHVAARREEALFESLQAKDLPELERLLGSVREPWRKALLCLPRLYGDDKVLREAARRLPALAPIRAALRALARLAAALDGYNRRLLFDLGELRGYRYHTGVVFAAYAAGFAGAIARGGRYDHIGQAFGRARPATGFSLDLRQLAAAAPDLPQRRILAPWVDAPALERLVRRLRARGEIVVRELPGHAATRAELACDHVIAQIDGRWQVRPAPGRAAPVRTARRAVRRATGRGPVAKRARS
jgi:ATP phosphoribosyltransferase regulatory subunit